MQEVDPEFNHGGTWDCQAHRSGSGSRKFCGEPLFVESYQGVALGVTWPVLAYTGFKGAVSWVAWGPCRCESPIIFSILTNSLTLECLGHPRCRRGAGSRSWASHGEGMGFVRLEGDLATGACSAGVSFQFQTTLLEYHDLGARWLTYLFQLLVPPRARVQACLRGSGSTSPSYGVDLRPWSNIDVIAPSLPWRPARNLMSWREGSARLRQLSSFQLYSTLPPLTLECLGEPRWGRSGGSRSFVGPWKDMGLSGPRRFTASQLLFAS